MAPSAKAYSDMIVNMCEQPSSMMVAASGVGEDTFRKPIRLAIKLSFDQI